MRGMFAEYRRDFQFDSDLSWDCFGDTHPLNISIIDPPEPQLTNI